MKKKDGVSKTERRTSDFPELRVGFPERNDASEPHEMERVHVDLDTMNISRKKENEVDRAILEQETHLDNK